jgi:hypothetical protein
LRTCLLSLEKLEDRLCPSLTLTQAGIDAGLSLSTFASDFPNGDGLGPLGIAFPNNGGVLVSDSPGNVRLFPTAADGQSALDVPPAQNYGLSNATDLAQVGGAIYMTQLTQGRIVQINPDGTFNRAIVDQPTALGLVANPTNGHLFVSTGSTNRVMDVDPIAQVSNPFVNGQLDGITISADGSTLYGAQYTNGHVLGFDTSTGSLVFDSGFIPGRVDGVVAGTGSQAGHLYVNTNAGTVVQVDLATLTKTVIADSGSRGDFLTLDPNDGSVLVTQTDAIFRLQFPSGGAGRSEVPLLLGGSAQPRTAFAYAELIPDKSSARVLPELQPAWNNVGGQRASLSGSNAQPLPRFPGWNAQDLMFARQESACQRTQLLDPLTALELACLKQGPIPA